LSKLGFSVGQFGQHMKPSLTLRGWGRDRRTKGTALAAEVRFSKLQGEVISFRAEFATNDGERLL
jgi:hypothetical protein